MASSMRGGRGRKFKAEINVVPYIDVMLVLLVIFMVVAPLTTPGVVNLPSAEKTNQPPTEYIEITMKEDKGFEIGVKQSKQSKGQAEQVSRDGLMSKLRTLHSKNPEYPVMISADKEIKYGDVVQMISDTKKVGINRVGLATK